MKSLLFILSFLLISVSFYGQKVNTETTAMQFYNNGNANFDLKKYAEAIVDYTKAIELNANFADAYYNRGTAKNNLNNPKGALEDYSKAIELSPTYISAYNNRAAIKKNLKDYKGAISDYSSAIGIDSTFAAAYFNRGNIEILIQQKDDGCRDLRKSLKLGASKAYESISRYCN